MNIKGIARLVFSTLLARKGRSFLTILGIVIGVSGVIIIIAMGASAQNLILGQVTKLGTNLLSVMPGKSNENGPPSQAYGVQITSLVTEDAVALRDKNRVPHAAGVVGAVTGSANVIWQNREYETRFTGTEADYPKIVNLNMQAGRFFDEREDKGNANVIVLGSMVKDELFGQGEALGKVVKIKNVPFLVIGVLEEKGSFMFQNQDDQVMIPLELAQQQLLGIHHLQSISIKVDSSENMESTIADVKQVLMERHRIKRDIDADFTVRSIADAIKIFTQITDALRLFLVSMAGIALLVGGIGILNIMLVTVAERTREIGLRKAVGATNSSVLKQFLLESAALTLLGGVIGIIVGVLVSFALALVAQGAGFDWPFIISPISIVLAVGVSVLTGVVFGIYPAFKASRLSPIDALRYE
ncbi:MAG: ABC transporter permease [Acidobacteriaceae bacterium]